MIERASSLIKGAAYALLIILLVSSCKNSDLTPEPSPPVINPPEVIEIEEEEEIVEERVDNPPESVVKSDFDSRLQRLIAALEQCDYSCPIELNDGDPLCKQDTNP